MAMAWSAPESGILRKTVPTGNIEELLVFGYACKIFRDDEKALYIDQGKHLIPWMGDVKLKIDRYDCRGHLSDISKYEASREGYDAMRWLGLSEKERQLEELCDRERYYSLEINEEEEEMYKEEESKRQKTNAIAYSYDVPTNPDAKPLEEATVQGAEEAEEPYKPPPILDVPVDIEIPKTVKENARIEKTASFVCRQGPQMEILIKAKQGDNPQFSFLNQGDKLNRFYRHVLAALKNGIYKGYESLNVQKIENSAEAQEQDSNAHYLHPSLLSANAQPEPPTAVTVPQIPYKPSVNCSYSQLVNRIQGNQNEEPAAPKTPQPISDFSQLTYEQQQYYHYYYTHQYYEYCKQVALYQQEQAGNSGQVVPPTDFENLDPSMQAYIQQMAYTQYMQHAQQQSSNNSYAQIVSNVNKESNPYSAQVPLLPENLASQEEAKEEQKPTVVGDNCEVIVKKPLLSLAAYGSGSDSDSEGSTDSEPQEDKKEYKSPTGENQAVIDKMAVYVSKNGEQFEDIVKAKGDARFSFLNEDHEFNAYYREKIRQLKGDASKEHPPKDKEKVKTAKKEKKVIAPVSFSIKKAKDDQPKEIKSALPIEESDEEEVQEEQPVTLASAPTTLVAAVTRQPEVPKKTQSEVVVDNPAKEDDSTKCTTIVVDERNGEDSRKAIVKRTNSRDSSDRKIKESSPKKNGLLDGDDPILEMIELSDDVEDKKDAKRAEDRIKDKLAAAAREKMASASKDKALQLERRRRAAAFLKLKSVEKVPLAKETEKEKSSSPLRRDSIEVILDSSDEKNSQKQKSPATNIEKETSQSKSRSPTKKYKDRSRSKYADSLLESERKRSRSTDSEANRSRDRERKKERSKRKKSKKDKKASIEEEGEYISKKNDEAREKRKKTHKRKHSRSKKKSKKHRRRSDSDSGTDSDRS